MHFLFGRTLIAWQWTHQTLATEWQLDQAYSFWGASTVQTSQQAKAKPKTQHLHTPGLSCPKCQSAFFVYDQNVAQCATP